VSPCPLLRTRDFPPTLLVAYGIRIANPDLPVINVGNRENPTYLPPQVCYVIPGQPAKTKLDPTQTQNMIRFAVRGPAQNATSIVTKGLQTAGLSASTNPLLVGVPLHRHRVMDS
jgi:eukaryotic translation initiation factor 2C